MDLVIATIFFIFISLFIINLIVDKKKRRQKEKDRRQRIQNSNLLLQYGKHNAEDKPMNEKETVFASGASDAATEKHNARHEEQQTTLPVTDEWEEQQPFDESHKAYMPNNHYYEETLADGEEGFSEDEKETPYTGTMDDPLPKGLKSWNWGAALAPVIWGIGNRTYFGFLALIPAVGYVFRIVLAIYGDKWAWKNNDWDDINHFRETQRHWTIAGIIIFTLIQGFFLFLELAKHPDLLEAIFRRLSTIF